MHNSLAKKLFAVGSAAAMIAALAPVTAFAAPHAIGTNILLSDGTVMFITTDSQGSIVRRPYTSGGAFLSYGFNSFGALTSASAEDLALPVGSFIPPQDGQIICSDRGTDKGTCYFITAGQKAGFTSEAVFKGLGFSFANSSFADVSWMQTAANIDSTTQAHRPGALVNNAGTVYLVGPNGLLGIPDLATFNSFGYSFKNVVPANAADKQFSQTGVMAARQPGQLNPTALTTNPNPNPNPTPVTGSVNASLSSSTPAVSTIPSGSFYAPVLELQLSNNTNQEVRFTGATVRRTGVLSDSDVQGILVTDQNGILHGSLVTFGQSIAFPGFASDPIIIPSGGSTRVLFNVNIRSTATTGTIGMTIASAADLTFTDATGNAVTVNGTFPAVSNIMNIVTGTGSIGALQLSARTIVGGTEASPIEIDQGAKDQDVAKFRFQETSGNEDIELCYVELQNNGSASQGDVANIRLVDQNNVVVATVASLTNNIAKFTISGLTGATAGPRGCYLIQNGQLRDFTVRIDTTSNTNSANRTVNFTIQNDFRVRARGLETGVGVTPTVVNPDTFPLGDTGDAGINFVKFRPGTLSISRATESLSGKLAKGATNVKLATFDFRAFGEDVEIQEIQFQILDENGAAFAVGAASLNGTLKIQQANGANIYSETATSLTLYGAGTGCTITSNVFATGTCTGTPSLKTLSSFYTIKANETGKVSFVGDIFQSAASTDGYTVKILGVKFRKASSNTFTTTSGLSISGNGLTVEDSNLTVTKSSSYNPVNLVKGGTVQKIASFDLQAGAAEDQRVNAIKIRTCLKAGAITVTTDCDTDVGSNLANVTTTTLKIGDQQLAPSQNITTTSGGTFSTNIIIPANQTKVVDVYAVVSTGFSTTNVAAEMTVTSVTGTQSQTTNTKAAVVGQSIAVAAGGTLSFQDLGNDGTVNVAKLLHANETDIPLFKFKVRETANAEAITLQKLYLGVDDALNTFVTYKLFNEATGQQIGSANNAIITTGDSGEVRFGGLSLSVPKGGELNLIVKGTTVDASTVPTSNFNTDLGVTFVEFNGGTSGANTRMSGGVVTGQHTADPVTVGTFTAGGDFIGVNDVTDFEVGDLSKLDANNDGTYTSATLTNNVSESNFQYIKTVGTNSVTLASFYEADVSSANPGVFTLVTGGNSLPIDSSPAIANGDTIRIDANGDGDFADTFTINGGTSAESATYTVAGFNANGGSADSFNIGVDFSSNAKTAIQIYVTSKTQDVTGSLTSGGRVTPYGFSSFSNAVREIEPVITSVQVGAGSQVTENEVGTFVIQNQGGRSLVVKQLRFELSGSYNINAGFFPKNFKLDRADTSTGARISNTFNNGASLGSPKLVYTASGGAVGNAVVAGAVSQFATSIVIDNGAGAASNITLVAGDRVGFTSTTENNGGIGYRLTAVTTTLLTITPGVQVALLDNTVPTLIASNPTVGATSAIESGQVINFDISGASITEEIAGNNSKGYVVLADTTNIKNNSSQGTTATTQIRMLGSKASATPVATDGLQWSYTSTSDGTVVDNQTISDSYIVTGKSLLYQ
jgi:hypothetical protein